MQDHVEYSLKNVTKILLDNGVIGMPRKRFDRDALARRIYDLRKQGWHITTEDGHYRLRSPIPTIKKTKIEMPEGVDLYDDEGREIDLGTPTMVVSRGNVAKVDKMRDKVVETNSELPELLDRIIESSGIGKPIRKNQGCGSLLQNFIARIL